MSSITSMPANRVASLTTFLAGLAGLGTSLAGVWPNSTTNEIAQILGGAGTLAGPLSHVIGSWLWDRTPAGQAAASAKFFSKNAEPTVTVAGSGTGTNLESGTQADDTIPPDDLPENAEDDGPWWKGDPEIDPQPSEPSIESEQFDEPISESVPGSDQIAEPDLSEFGGSPDPNHAPDHALAPEPTSDTSTTEATPDTDTGPEIQKQPESGEGS